MRSAFHIVLTLSNSRNPSRSPDEHKSKNDSSFELLTAEEMIKEITLVHA